jgi:hypothetical protein
MRTHVRALALAGATLLAGCDGAEPNVPTGIVRVLAAPRDVQIEVGGGPSAVPLDGVFRHSLGEDLAFSFEVGSPEVALVEWGDPERRTLRVTALQAGLTPVTVSGRAARGESAAASFQVRVVDHTCPHLPTDAYDFVPMAAGARWEFDYVTQSGGGHGAPPSVRIDGRLSLTFQADQCREGVRTVTVLQEVDATRFVRVEGDWQPTGPWIESQERIVTEAGDNRVSFALPLQGTSGPRYGSSSGPTSVTWQAGCAGEAVFEQGLGLISSFELCGSSFETRSATLQRVL